METDETDYPTIEDIPDEWVPLSEHERQGNIDGGTFIDPTRSRGFDLIRYHEDRKNEDIPFFDVSLPRLIHRLIEYNNDEGDFDR